MNTASTMYVESPNSKIRDLTFDHGQSSNTMVMIHRGFGLIVHGGTWVVVRSLGPWNI